MTGSRPLREVGGRPMPFSGPLETEAPAATGVKAQVSFDRRIDRILLALLGRRSRSVRTLAREAGVRKRTLTRVLQTVAVAAAESAERGGERR